MPTVAANEARGRACKETRPRTEETTTAPAPVFGLRLPREALGLDLRCTHLSLEASLPFYNGVRYVTM